MILFITINSFNKLQIKDLTNGLLEKLIALNMKNPAFISKLILSCNISLQAIRKFLNLRYIKLDILIQLIFSMNGFKYKIRKLKIQHLLVLLLNQIINLIVKILKISAYFYLDKTKILKIKSINLWKNMLINLSISISVLKHHNQHLLNSFLYNPNQLYYLFMVKGRDMKSFSKVWLLRI